MSYDNITYFEAGEFKNIGFLIGLVKTESKSLDQFRLTTADNAGGSCD